MLLFVRPSGTDTFIVTVMIFTAVAKKICKLTFHNLTTVIFRVLTLSVSWCVSVCWVCERFSGPRRPECLQVASMETCSENTAAAQPGMRYLVCGEACYLTRGPPITTPRSLPRFVRSLIQMEIERVLRWLWSKTLTTIWSESSRLYTLRKRTCLMITWRLQSHGCFVLHSCKLNEGCDCFKMNRIHCVVW